MCSLKDYYADPNGLMLDRVWHTGLRKGWDVDRIRTVQRFLLARRERQTC